MDDDLARALGLDRARGALVEHVEPSGPAARAGLQPGDVILAVNGQDVPHAIDLPRMAAEHPPGSRLRLTVLRNKQALALDVTLGALAQGPPGVTSRQPAPRVEPGGGASSLGVDVGDARGGGAIVRTVFPLGPADGKLVPGDVIEALDGRPVADAHDLAAKAQATPTSQPLLLRIRRGDRSLYVGIERR